MFKFKPNAVVLSVATGYNPIPVKLTGRFYVFQGVKYHEGTTSDGSYTYNLDGNIHEIESE